MLVTSDGFTTLAKAPTDAWFLNGVMDPTKPLCLDSLLKLKGIEFEERKIGDGWTKEDLLEAVPTARTVPQIFLGEELIGGFTELRSYLDKASV